MAATALAVSTPTPLRRATRCGARIVARLLRDLAVTLGQVSIEFAQVLELPRDALPQCRRQRFVGERSPRPG